MKRVTFDEAEIAQPADFSAIGAYAQDALDAVAGGALGWPAHWARITVSQKTANVVTVSAGEYHDGEAMYGLFDAADLNLQTYKPVIVSDERWIALILRGAEIVEAAARPFETGEEPLSQSVPVSQSTPKYVARKGSIVVQVGEIAPAPAIRPTINEDDCCIAFVLLKTTGIMAIEANEASRVKTVYEIEGRLAAVEVRVERLFRETAAIATDVASIAASVKAAPSRALVSQLANDVSRTRQMLNFPDDARNYFFDQGLLPDFWDLTHVNSLTRIREGVRMQYAQQYSSDLRMLNADDPDVTVVDDIHVLPAYSEVLRIESPVGSGRQDISNTVHTIVTARIKTKKTTLIRYGETFFVCENVAGWEGLSRRRPGEMFKNNGKIYEVVGYDPNFIWNRVDGRPGHYRIAVKGVSYDTVESTYTDYTSEEFGLTGAIYAQSFLNAQMMVATSVDLYFTRIGPTGDVRLCICELNASGAPDYVSVIATASIAHADLSTGWKKFALPPTLLEPGRRYAWFTVTTGNHQVATNSGNKFTGGTKFSSSDGVWSQGSTAEDFAFRLYAARFERSRTVIPFESLTLENGMSEVELVYDGWQPDSTALVWEIKPQGWTEWVPIDDRDPNPLANLPPLVQLRLVMIGTQDVAPMIVLDTHARSLTGRCRADMTAVSKALEFGFSTDTVQMVINVDNWDAEHHTLTPRLIVGASTLTALAIVATVDPTKPSRTRIVADFVLGAPAASARARIDATTDSVLLQPFVQDIQINAF